MINWEGYPTAFGMSASVPRIPRLIVQFLEALQYPYLLAFEPNFVEIRHVETGQLSQIFQGNNLRCLYAYTPPSQSNTHASNAGSHNSYASFSSQYNLAQQGSGQGQYGDRSSMYSQFGTGYPQTNGYTSVDSSVTHKIIMVSDDSVVSLRPAMPSDPVR